MLYKLTTKNKSQPVQQIVFYKLTFSCDNPKTKTGLIVANSSFALIRP